MPSLTQEQLQCPHYRNTSSRAQHTVKLIITKTSGFGADKGLLRAMQEDSDLYLKNHKLPESCQQSPFLGKVREGHGELLHFLMSDPLLLRSGHGHVTTSLQTSTKQILCSDKKGKGPQAQLSPSEVQILAKRRQISAGGSLRARSPDCAICHH